MRSSLKSSGRSISTAPSVATCVQVLEAKELELIGQKEAALASERRRKDQALSSARRRLEEEKVQRLQSYRQKAEAKQ